MKMTPTAGCAIMRPPTSENYGSWKMMAHCHNPSPSPTPARCLADQTGFKPQKIGLRSGFIGSISLPYLKAGSATLESILVGKIVYVDIASLPLHFGGNVATCGILSSSLQSACAFLVGILWFSQVLSASDMNIQRSDFGQTPAGQKIDLFTLTNQSATPFA